MTELLNLGELYVSDFLAPGEEPRSEPAELRLVMDDDTGIVHLAEQPASELMWGRYWYRSGTNATMRAELYDIVQSVEQLVDVGEGEAWVDIASNDGTLLSFVDTPTVPDLVRRSSLGRVRIGVDPVEGDIHYASLQHADLVIQEPFTSEVAQRIRHNHGPVKVITCIAMFYDLLDPTDFLAGVHDLLADDGVFVLQMSYTPLMLEQLAFDNICHEHARYYTLTTLSVELERAGFRVVDVELNDTNGGSFRVTAQRQDGKPFRTQPWRDVASMRVVSLLAYESTCGYNTPAVWRRFVKRVEQLRYDVRSFVDQANSVGKRVYAYGASTKGNTLLQYCGLDHTKIVGIAERQEAKVGLRTVGTDIPIVSEDEWRMSRADYTLMLPWQFRAEFVEREAAYLDSGGTFVVPCPRFELVGDGPVMAFGDGRKPA